MGKTDVSEMIRTSNARDFGLSEMLEYCEQVLRISEIEELVEREKKIDLLKWNWMEDVYKRQVWFYPVFCNGGMKKIFLEVMVTNER